jgi:exodeoxyribonuclease (lambda-induced)
MIYLDVVQGTPEWKQARAGKITASRFRDACDTLKSGAPSAKAIAYAAQVAIERISGEPAEDGFVSYAMRRGTELEPRARMEYEDRTGNFVTEAGIVLTDDEIFSYSTDGFIGEDGMLEIKCILSPEKLIAVWRDRDFSEYIHQCRGGLWLTGRKWIDLAIYAPQLEAVGKSLLIHRITRDEDAIADLQDKLLAFAAVVDANEQLLRAVAA